MEDRQRDEANVWMRRRESEYRGVGLKVEFASEFALRDAEDRYTDGMGRLRDEPVTVYATEVEDTDPRLTQIARRDRSGVVLKPHRVVREPELGWVFRITRDEARAQLEAGDGRTSDYCDRVEWVSQNLNSPLASPENAPCNAAWSMLLWATDNQKEFFSIQRQVMSKAEFGGAEDEALAADLKVFEDLISRFSCWNRLDAKVKSGEIQLLHD
jgi:hypothetical protein